MISKVKVKKLNIKEDTRGWFTEILRFEELYNKKKKFGQMYVTIAKPGQTKGRHYHKRKTEYFCVIKGNAMLTLIDKKTLFKQKIRMGEDNMVMVQIPPMVWHAIENTEKKNEIYLLAYIDEPYNPNDPDTIHEELS